MRRFLAIFLFALTALTAAYAQSAPQTAVVYVALSSSLDASTVKSGDLVSATLCDKAKFPDGSTLPKSTTLTGHVLSTSNGNSVSLIFDEAQVNGKAQPVHVAIRIANDAAGYEDDSYNSSDIKSTGAPVSKLHGIELTDTANASGTFTAQKSKHLWLDYRTLLGVVVSKS